MFCFLLVVIFFVVKHEVTMSNNLCRVNLNHRCAYETLLKNTSEDDEDDDYTEYVIVVIESF